MSKSDRATLRLTQVATETPQVFQFGDWTVEPLSNQLSREGQTATLEPLTMNVLAMLLARPGEVVSTDAILDALWSGRNAEPAMVSRCINQIRKALGDNAQSPKYIETVRKRGYRAIAPVATLQTDGTLQVDADERAPAQGKRKNFSLWMALASVLLLASATWLVVRDETPAQSTHQPSVAVLPFVTEGSHADGNSFGEGIAADLIVGLSRATGLKVIARTSAFEYAENKNTVVVGAELGVDHVVLGRLRRDDDHLRVNVQMVDAVSGQVLWAEQYDRLLVDVFAVQDEIVESILSELRLRLDATHARTTVAPEAYDAYLRGRYFQSRIGHRPEHSRRFFERAIALEPRYAAAHASLAWTYNDAVNLGYMPPGEGFPEALTHFSNALALEPDNIEAQWGRTIITVLVSHDYQFALDTAAELLTRDPTNWRVHLVYSGVLRAIERHEAALAICSHWVQIDPLNTRARIERATVLGHGLGRIDAAKADLDFVFQRTGKRPLFVEEQMAIDSGDLDWFGQVVARWQEQEGSVPDLLNAKLHYARGNLEAARAYAESALASGEATWEALLLLDRPDQALAAATERLASGSPKVRHAVIEQERPDRLAIPYLAGLPGVAAVRTTGRLDADALEAIETPPPPHQ